MRLADRPRRLEPASFIAERLESRQVLSVAPPVVGGTDYAADNDTYTMTITPNQGAVIAAGALTSVAWGATTVLNIGSQSTGLGAGRIEFDTFKVTLPPSSLSGFFGQSVATGVSFAQVEVDSFIAGTGQLRASWTLKDVAIVSFGQSTRPDGTLEDAVEFHLNQMDEYFYRYNPDGSLLEKASSGWDRVRNISTTSDYHDFNSNYVATTPNVLQTFEFNQGQQPISNFSFSVSNTYPPGRVQFSDIEFDVVDGRDTLTQFRRLASGTAMMNSIVTQRDPSTGVATERYRFYLGGVTRMSFSDRVGDKLPRAMHYALEAGEYQIVHYNYDNNTYPSVASSGGWNRIRNVSYSPGTNSAHVPPPTYQLRKEPLDTVTFNFTAPVVLSTDLFRYEGFADPTKLDLISSNGGRTWTFINLSKQQFNATGHYAIKLLSFVYNPDTTNDGLPLFLGSAAASWDVDPAPKLLGSAFARGATAASAFGFDFRLSEPVTPTGATLGVLIRRAGDGAIVTAVPGTLSPDGQSVHAALAAPLANGRYVATLPAGSVRDSVGSVLDADANLSFTSFAGDVNGDARVDFDDLLVLAKHYNQLGRTYAEGNLDYSADGSVSFSDLLILAKAYNTSLPAAAAPDGIEPQTAPITRKRSTLLEI